MALEFDLNKTFDQNIAEFRKHLESLDPECVKIFLANQATLLGDPARARAGRTVFNAAVLEDLKALPAKNGAT